jgi:hypothetical protein
LPVRTGVGLHDILCSGYDISQTGLPPLSAAKLADTRHEIIVGESRRDLLRQIGSSVPLFREVGAIKRYEIAKLVVYRLAPLFLIGLKQR